MVIIRLAKIIRSDILQPKQNITKKLVLVYTVICDGSDFCWHVGNDSTVGGSRVSGRGPELSLSIQ